jgi:hypothetical protein
MEHRMRNVLTMMRAGVLLASAVSAGEVAQPAFAKSSTVCRAGGPSTGARLRDDATAGQALSVYAAVRCSRIVGGDNVVLFGLDASSRTSGSLFDVAAMRSICCTVFPCR